MKKNRELNALGKTKEKALKQAKRWFKMNPNRKFIDLITTDGTIKVGREEVINENK